MLMFQFLRNFSLIIVFWWTCFVSRYNCIIQLVCILTGKRVLHMPFAGPNHFFGLKTSFSIFFHHKRWLTPKSWSTPAKNFLSFFHYWLKKGKKFVLTQKQMIWTSKQHAEHPFPGPNTQHTATDVKLKRPILSIINIHNRGPIL